MKPTDSRQRIYQTSQEPVNKTAKIVTSKASLLNRAVDLANPVNHQLAFKTRINEVLTRQNPARMPRVIKDWTGTQLSRITVIAYSHSRWKKGDGNTHYWVVRCACGEYEMRKHSSLNRSLAKQTEDMCEQCKKAEHLRYTASKAP